MTKLGSYELIGKMTNHNSGYSVWGFGKKHGAEFFIKEFLSPKYPANDTASTPQQLEKRRKRCEQFALSKTNLYRVVNQYSDGNAVRVNEFFRVGSKYYIATMKIQDNPVDLEQIRQLPEAEIRRLCAIIAHTMAGLHRGGLVHADLKPSNILFARTRKGNLTAKIIDFDSSFLESDPPRPGDDLVGDQNYFSPEACCFIWEEEVPLTVKMDVFALGVLFHQYFTGELPGYDHENNSCPGEAVAKGEELVLSQQLPGEIAGLLSRMLQEDPARRPDLEEVFAILRPIPPEPEPKPEPKPEPEPKPVPLPVYDPSIWLRAGNLDDDHAPVPVPQEDFSDIFIREDPVEDSTKSDRPFFTPGNL